MPAVSPRCSIPTESDAGHFLTPPSPNENTPEKGVFSFVDGRLSGIEPESKAPQTSVLTVTP